MEAQHSTNLQNAISRCTNMIPVVSKTFYQNLRSDLSLAIPDPTNTENDVRRSSRTANKTKNDRLGIENILDEFSTDLRKLSENFSKVVGAVSQLLNRVESLESRIDEIESKVSSSQPGEPSNQSYASVLARNPQNKNHDNRIARLEYSSSEEDRKSKMLEVQISHPSIDSKSQNLTEHARTFLSNKLRMSPREIDANMIVSRSSKPNTIVLKCSDRKFKVFVYAARKKLRDQSPDDCAGLYINDNLTSYNYTILKKLKTDSKIRTEAQKTTFATVYTYNGKVFVKRFRSDSSENAIHVRTPLCIEKLFDEFDTQTD